MGSGTLLSPTPAAQRPSGAGRGESRSWADLGEGGALEVRGSSGNSQCTRALGRCERHAPERLGRRGAGCGTSPSKARATDAVVTGLCRGYLCAVSQALLTLLGAACERTGLDKRLKVNTAKKRTHSLFRQGLYWYAAIPNMPDDWLRPLMDAFTCILQEHAILCAIYGVI